MFIPTLWFFPVIPSKIPLLPPLSLFSNAPKWYPFLFMFPAFPPSLFLFFSTLTFVTLLVFLTLRFRTSDLFRLSYSLYLLRIIAERLKTISLLAKLRPCHYPKFASLLKPPYRACVSTPMTDNMPGGVFPLIFPPFKALCSEGLGFFLPFNSTSPALPPL